MDCKSLPKLISGSFLPLFLHLLGVLQFQILHLTLYFELIFVYSMWERLNFVHCLWISSFSNTIYWRDYPFSIVYFWHTWGRSVDHICVDLFPGSLLSIGPYNCFMPLSYCFYYCSFVIYFKIRMYNASSFVLASNCFSYSGSIVVPNEF